ncbi:cysteine desulfurase [Micromonospora sp. NPDC007271]|uniref:aminotransferase class V-fold PLP-dependent enzyme n=1 Tax=Micromonospora sp. NPDC007271 TaxID=3154587 RepID=UPI0033F42076
MTMTPDTRLDSSGACEGVRDDFPIMRTRFGDLPLVYFDNAATAQKPRAVLDAVTDFYSTTNSNVGRGYHRLGLAATERLEQAREMVRAFIGARSVQEVIFTSGTTHSVNLVADAIGRSVLGRGDEVVVTEMEHNSNLLPWRALCERTGARLIVVPVGPHGSVELADFAAALGPRTKIAAFAHVSNVLGTVNPVREMAAQARRHGALVLVDGAQAAPHRPVDVTELGVDFYCFSAHKAYGPMGIGVLYGRQDVLAELPPYQVGGGTVKGVALNEPVAYLPAPARFEAGTPDVAGAIGLAAAITYLDDLGWDAIQAHDARLVHTALELLSTLERVRVVGDPARDPAGIVSIDVAGIHPYDVGGHLDGNGIAVRCGVHCASAFLDSLGLLGTVRISFAVYNTVAEIERLCQCLETVKPGMWTREHPTVRFL